MANLWLGAIGCLLVGALQLPVAAAGDIAVDLHVHVRAFAVSGYNG